MIFLISIGNITCLIKTLRNLQSISRYLLSYGSLLYHGDEKTSTTLCWTQNSHLRTVTNCGLSVIYFEVTPPLDCHSQRVSSSKTSNGAPFNWCHLGLPRSLHWWSPALLPTKRSCLNPGRKSLAHSSALAWVSGLVWHKGLDPQLVPWCFSISIFRLSPML